MAERIPIMLALSDKNADASDLSDEAVLHSVFGERGWDANVTAPLDQIQNGSTDELCLSGIAGPFVLFSRKGFSAAVEQLSRLGINGAVRNVLEDSESVAVVSTSRSIYFFQLNNRAQFERSLQKVRELQASIHTKVFKLQLPNSDLLPIQKKQEPPVSGRPRPIENGSVSSQPNGAKADHNDANLDRLLDELDQSNI